MTMVVRPDNHHNAIAVPDSNAGNGIAQLIEWAQAAEAASQLAVRLVDTQFVPKQYFRKPEEATAAILAGAEMGLSPMAALRAFDPIQGTPAPKAITLRAVVQAHGHLIRIDKSTATEAVVSGRRKGDPDWQTVTWTIERAQQAGYPAKNPNWKSNPTAMLVARATSEIARWIASDAIMGMPYSSEEIRDEGSVYEGRPAPRVTTAEILASAPISAQPAVDAPEPAAHDAAPAREPMTKPQQGKMHALFNEVGIADRGQRMQYVNEVLAEVVGPERQVSSSSELSKDETRRVIDKLQAWADSLEPSAAEVAEVVGDVR